jgi:hypothetical protein
MEVDGHYISFEGSENADYFKNHYRRLGYEIVTKKKAGTY